MYNMEFILGDFNAKLEREDICKRTRGMDDNDHDARVINFATSKIYLLRARCSRTEKFINTPGPLLIGTLTTRMIT